VKHNAGILFHEEPMEISPRNAYDREGKRKYLNRAEGQKFLEQVLRLPKMRALFCLTIYYTGCRISEALNLCWSNLDSESKVLTIRSLKKRGRIEIRRVPIPEFLSVELRRCSGFGEDQRLWMFSRTTGWRIIKGVMSKAGIAGIHATTKGLRHGFGVRGALGQIPLTLIQQWMGHADVTTTAIYLAVRDEEERALIERTW
jgi:integrase/recombinase XerD